MPTENRNRRNVAATLGTMLLVTLLVALMAVPQSPVISGTHLTLAGAPGSASMTPAHPRASAAPSTQPSTVVGPIHGKYFLGNTSVPTGTSNYAYSAVVDTATQTVYSANLLASTITAYAEATGQLQQTAIVGSEATALPFSLALATKTNTLYVAMESSPTGFVLALNKTTLHVIANISTAGAPNGPFQPSFVGAYDPSSNQVFFTNQTNGTLLAINAANNHVAGYIPCPATPCSGGTIIAVPQLGELVQTTGGAEFVIYNTSTNTPVATLTVPTVPALSALTQGAAYIPSSQQVVIGNISASNSGVFFVYNLSTHAYLGTLPHDPARVNAMVYDATHNDVVATGVNGSRMLVAVNAGTGVVDGLYQEARSGLDFLSLALDEPASQVITSGIENNSSFSFHLPSLTPAVAYTSFAYEQFGVAVDSSRGTAFTFNFYQNSIRATSEATGAVLWTDYLRYVTPGFNPNSIVVDSGTDTLYVILQGTGHVAVFNGTTGLLETRLALALGVNATTLAIDPTAHLLYVAQNDQNVTVWSTTTHGLLGTVLVMGLDACGAAASPVLHLAYFTNCAGDNVSSVNGLSFTAGPTFGTGLRPEGIVLDSGGILYVADESSDNITRINTATATELSPISTGTFAPVQIAVDSSDGILALTSFSSQSLDLVDSVAGTLLATAFIGTLSYALAYDSVSGIFIAPLVFTGETFELRTLAAPSAPTEVGATSGNSTVKAQWTAPPTTGLAISNYTVSLATSASGPWGNNQTVTATNYTYSGLSDGTRYFISVTATTLAGTGPRSLTANATPLGVPFPPTSVAAVAGNSTTLNVSWAAPASTQGASIVNYTLKWTVAGGLTWASVSEGTVLKAVLTGLHSSTNYTVIVVAWNSVGSSNPSTQSTAATKVAPVVIPPHTHTNASGTSNLLLYVALGIVLLAVIAAVAVLMMRRKKPTTVAAAPGPSGPTPPGPVSPSPPGSIPPSPWAEDSGPAPPPGAI
jgi:YVTN family beta-propeller protein